MSPQKPQRRLYAFMKKVYSMLDDVSSFASRYAAGASKKIIALVTIPLLRTTVTESGSTRKREASPVRIRVSSLSSVATSSTNEAVGISRRGASGASANSRAFRHLEQASRLSAFRFRTSVCPHDSEWWYDTSPQSPRRSTFVTTLRGAAFSDLPATLRLG